MTKKRTQRMTQALPTRLPHSTTLADALSSQVKHELDRLRRDLTEQAREAIANQLAGVQAPWRQQGKPAISWDLPKEKRGVDSAPRAPVVTVRQRPERRKSRIRPKSIQSRNPEIAPRPQKPSFEYWDFPNETAVREPAPDTISDTDRLHLEELLRAGIDWSIAGGEELFIVLGLDLGTSSTKMIVRLPYEAGEPTIAIPAPGPCRSSDDPYLWQTVLWLRKDGTFLPWPEAGAMILNSLKQGLIQGRSETAITDSEATVTVSKAQAGVAYLAFVIRYVKGWLLRNRPDLFRRRKPVWFVNFGMPTASYDDLKLIEPYRRIGASALQLAKIDSPVTVEAARLFLDDPHVVQAGASEETAQDLGVAVFPETAAAVTGFAKSPRNAPGLYLLVDIGAMTRMLHKFSSEHAFCNTIHRIFWSMRRVGQVHRL